MRAVVAAVAVLALLVSCALAQSSPVFPDFQGTFDVHDTYATNWMAYHDNVKCVTPLVACDRTVEITNQTITWTTAGGQSPYCYAASRSTAAESFTLPVQSWDMDVMQVAFYDVPAADVPSSYSIRYTTRAFTLATYFDPSSPVLSLYGQAPMNFPSQVVCNAQTHLNNRIMHFSCKSGPCMSPQKYYNSASALGATVGVVALVAAAAAVF